MFCSSHFSFILMSSSFISLSFPFLTSDMHNCYLQWECGAVEGLKAHDESVQGEGGGG